MEMDFNNQGDDLLELVASRLQHRIRKSDSLGRFAGSERTGAHLTLCDDLHHGLNNDEFVVHYQPQLHVSTNTVVGVEALIRWQHPTLGLVPPSEFIPAAEEKGLITQLTEWVMKTACEQLKDWQSVGLLSLKMSVNISARDFEQTHFVEKILSILRDTQVMPHYLTLELTEGLLMKNPDEAAETLKELRKRGIQTALDDFGTGYSSLSYLKIFVADTLKIDKSFIRDIIADEDSSNIVKAVIVLANSLHMEFIAEGVETEAQKTFLLENNCHVMQGSLFSKPLPGEECTEFLLAQQQQQVDG